MKKLIQWYFSPLLFGFAFIAPLIAQSLIALDVETPVPAIVIGLVVGGALGVMAQTRGTWLWIK
tara:strand:+ start:514 stop:705 length:192 start_codon:yes stop_codon:yes gene_type:complete